MAAPERQLTALALVLALAACGGSGPDPATAAEASRAEDADATGEGATRPPETFAGLPHLVTPLERTSTRFRRVWRLTRASAEVPLPTLEESASLEAFSAWARELMAPWLRARLDTIESVVIELRAMRAGQPSEYLIGSALLGFLFDDAAEQIRAVPIPRVEGFDTGELRQVLEREAVGLVQGARDGYQRCLGATVGEPTVMAWRQYCEERARVLR